MQCTIRKLATLVFMVSTLALPVLADTITVKGSTTNLPIAQLTAEEFNAIRPDIVISVQGGGSGTGIAAIIDGTADIGNTSRFMRVSEWSNAVAKGVLPYNWYIANDGLAVVVHPSNPVQELTFTQIQGMYAGTISNWSQVGGPDLRLVAVSRDTASGTFGSFKDLVLDGAEVTAPGALFQPSTAAVEGTVAATPGAIGYIGLGYLNPRVRALAVARTEAGPFVLPSIDNVVAGQYAISRPLFMITNDFPTGAVLDYINFILSDAGQRLVLETGYVPVRVLTR